MQISPFLQKAHKICYYLNILLFLIMIVIVALNLAKIPQLSPSGPIIVFIIDIISNFIWLFASFSMMFSYIKNNSLSSFIAITLYITLWFLKLIEIILICVLIATKNDENPLTFGDKTSSIIGISIDLTIIIPLTALAISSNRYIILKKNIQD